VVLLAATMALGGCANYRVGNDTLYNTEIHTVYVPIFESSSFRRYLGEQLTEAVMKEIEEKTPFKVVGDSSADSILSGKIVGETKNMLFTNKYNDPRDSEVALRVQVRWLDRESNVLRQTQSIPVPADLATIVSSSTVVPEVGQSISTAQQKAIHKLAKQIVAMMETPW
jgi:hypothetical protein